MEDDFYNNIGMNISMVTRGINQRERKDLRNYLFSIAEDAEFVAYLRRSPELNANGTVLAGLPYFANKRNGLWYLPTFDGTAYFKSTDGHSNHWDFSTTRLNLHVAVSAAKHFGIVIVDSTRRGKRYPDSMSKTIPIWCYVINRLLAQHYEAVGITNDLFKDVKLILPNYIPPSEVNQIQKRIEDIYENKLKNVSTIILEELAGIVDKPLVPQWICHGDLLWENPPDQVICRDNKEFGYFPVVCVSASKCRPPEYHRQFHSWTYIQGAGDDEENWSKGLTPLLFYKHKYDLLNCTDEDECLQIVENIVKGGSEGDATEPVVGSIVKTPFEKSGLVSIGETGVVIGSCTNLDAFLLPCSNEYPFGLIINCSNLEMQNINEIVVKNKEAHNNLIRYEKLNVLDGKRANCPDFWQNHVFPTVLSLAYDTLKNKKKCCIVCKDGKESSVIVLLAILLVFFPSNSRHELAFDDSIFLAQEKCNFTKDDIRIRMVWVQRYFAESPPSRRLIKQLNMFFIPSFGGWHVM